MCRRERKLLVVAVVSKLIVNCRSHISLLIITNLHSLQHPRHKLINEILS